MPFAYYGAKHEKAHKYPPPRFDLIIEPFAGAEGYSCHWARHRVTPSCYDRHERTPGHSCRQADLGSGSVGNTPGVRSVILNDADKGVVDTWHRVQRMTADDVRSLDAELDKERTYERLVAWAGGNRTNRLFDTNGEKVTSRMRSHRSGWGNVRERIIRHLDLVRTFEILHGDYRDLPDVEATWFIDPPYQPIAVSPVVATQRSSSTMPN